MVSRIGICSLLISFFMAVFSGISSFMDDANIWVGLTLFKLLGEDKTESIITWFDSAIIQDALDFLMYEMPMFGLVGIFGLLMLGIGLFVKEH